MNKCNLFNAAALFCGMLYLGACVASGQKEYDAGIQARSAGRYKEAIAYLNQAIEKEPGNATYQQARTDLKVKLIDQFVRRGGQALESQAPLSIGGLNQAKSELNKAREIDAQHPDVIAFSRRLAEAENELLNDVQQLYVDAQSAVDRRDWLPAYFNLQQVLSRFPNYEDALQLLEKVATDGSVDFFQQARTRMEQGWLLQAFNRYNLAVNHIQDTHDYQLNSLRNDLTARARFLAGQFRDQGLNGSAWYWYHKIQSADPEYPDIFYLTQEMEDHIKKSVQKSIAVFDFSSPSDSQDAGIILANNLITFLFDNASGDIKILERENLKSMIEEMKLGSMGVVSAQGAKEMGRVYGIDVAIMGSVLLYKVDTSVSQGTNSVRYQVGEKIEDNIDYLNWRARHPNPSSEELAQAPPAKVETPEFVVKDYRVTNHKKVGFVQLSFRIVDVRTGENIQVRTIERKEIVSDETSAGLPEADIQFDPLEIPTDTELLQRMTEDVVAELGREALRPLQNLEQTYFQQGENFIRRRDNLHAAESFVSALFNENLKCIQGSPLSHQAHQNLEKIFADYQVALGE